MSSWLPLPPTTTNTLSFRNLHLRSVFKYFMLRTHSCSISILHIFELCLEVFVEFYDLVIRDMNLFGEKILMLPRVLFFYHYINVN